MPSKLDYRELGDKYKALKTFTDRKAKLVTNKKVVLFFDYDMDVRKRYAIIGKTSDGFNITMNRQVVSKNNLETLKGVILHELAHIPYLEKIKRIDHKKGHDESNFKRIAKKLGVPKIYQGEFTSKGNNLPGAVIRKINK